MRLHEFGFLLDDERFSLTLEAEPGELLRPITGRLNLTLLAGPNGSGKTWILSSLVQLLHHADWHQERIQTDCIASYSLEDFGSLITLSNVGGAVSIESNGRTQTIGDSTSARKRNFYQPPSMFMPSTICSVFSTRGEYPKQKPPNARGQKTTTIYDIGALYGSDHYRVGSLSAGIGRLLTRQFSDARTSLAKITGLRIGKRVRVHPTNRLLKSASPTLTFLQQTNWNGGDAEWSLAKETLPWLTREWLPVTAEILKAEREHLIYINDVEIRSRRSRHTHSLMNLSAGQKMLLVRLLSILSSIDNNSLVIIEEPELHLDPFWCGGLLELLGAFFGRFSAHIILTTHNLSFLRCFPSECVTFLGEAAATENPKTFLASESVLADLFYRGQGLTVLDKTILHRLDSMNDDLERAAALDTFGEGPARFLGHRAMLRNE